MVKDARGIEVFGRGATIVETSVVASNRTPALGALSLLLAIAAAVCLGFGVALEAEGGSGQSAAVAAIVTSGGSVVGGFFAVTTGRGRLAGFLAMVVGAASNPYLLGMLLGYVESLSTS